jgi:hypothetical protein
MSLLLLPVLLRCSNQFRQVRLHHFLKIRSELFLDSLHGSSSHRQQWYHHGIASHHHHQYNRSSDSESFPAAIEHSSHPRRTQLHNQPPLRHHHRRLVASIHMLEAHRRRQVAATLHLSGLRLLLLPVFQGKECLRRLALLPKRIVLTIFLRDCRHHHQALLPLRRPPSQS